MPLVGLEKGGAEKGGWGGGVSSANFSIAEIGRGGERIEGPRERKRKPK